MVNTKTLASYPVPKFKQPVYDCYCPAVASIEVFILLMQDGRLFAIDMDRRIMGEYL